MEQKSIWAVVLAAGNSSRMGTSKMALAWGDSTVLETTLKHVKQANIEQLLLITGGYLELVEQLSGVRAVPREFNPNYKSGEILSSVKLALQKFTACDPEPDGVLVIPGDMPLITTELINRTIEIWLNAPEKIVAPSFQNRRGHPVIFPWEAFQEFETLPAEKSPRDLIKAKKELLMVIEVDDEAILIDIDTPAEYERHRPK